MGGEAQALCISVIIPLYNGRPHIEQALSALYQSEYGHWECIVVDDGSADGGRAVVEQSGAALLSTPTAKSGPALARNMGAEAARGAVLFFVDADVMVYPETLGRVAAAFSAPNPPDALFGSYDDEPAAPNFLSQYKNLQHHYIHQTAEADAGTFWSGCGAIWRDVFVEMGGFSTGFGRPSIEDIELGMRLKAAGHTIRLDKGLQVKHLKRWTLLSLLRSDILDRAAPWSRLILENGRLPDDLNLRSGHRFSAALVWLLLLCIIAGGLIPALWLFTPVWMAGLLGLNRPFYQFLSHKLTRARTVTAVLFHWFYLFYSSLTFVLVWLGYSIGRQTGSARTRIDYWLAERHQR